MIITSSQDARIRTKIGCSDECHSFGYTSLGFILVEVAAGGTGGVVGEEGSGLLVSFSEGPEIGDGDGFDVWWLRRACSARAFLAALC